MAALTAACARLHDRMDAEMLVKAHWAFARLRHRPPPGDMNRIVGAAKRLVGELPDEDRLTVMHAWGVLRVNPGDDIVSTFTESFRAGDVKKGDGDDEDASDAFNPEARLDGASCAKLLCAYGRTRHQPPAAHAAFQARTAPPHSLAWDLALSLASNSALLAAARSRTFLGSFASLATLMPKDLGEQPSVSL